MKNDKSQQSLKNLKEYLKKQMAEAEAQRGLGDAERAIITVMILEPLEKADQELRETAKFVFIASLMVGWVKLGFLPSQFKPLYHESGLELIATFFRLDPTLGASNAPSPSGVSYFWDGIICEGMYDWEDAKNAFDLSLQDLSLPLWMRVTAMQLKAWHHLRAREYDAARETLEQLRDNLSESKPKIDYIMGYVDAIENSGFGSLYAGPYDEMFVMIPEAEPDQLHCLTGEAIRTDTLARGISLTAPTIEALKLAISESIGTRLLMGIWQAKEDIIKSMPITHTLEDINQRLQSEHGDWVNRLVNQGALVNAEFLYQALKAKSWGGVITEYANSVEAEVKSKLLPRLDSVLKKNGTSLDSVEQSKVKRGGSNLGYAEVILRKIAEYQSLSSLLVSALPKDTCRFLLSELPSHLAKVRALRRTPAHGGAMTASQAEEMRGLVLVSPERPGLLKRLNEIGIPYTA